MDLLINRKLKFIRLTQVDLIFIYGRYKMITVHSSVKGELKGLSTDTKPTEGVSENTLFLELDTGDFYYFSGGEWKKFGGDE